MDSPHLDAFPARVTYPVGSHPGFLDKARILVFKDRVIVFVESRADRRRAVTVAHDVALASFERTESRVGVTLNLTTGETWTAGRGTGCGCGSPLKRATVRDLMALVAEAQPA